MKPPPPWPRLPVQAPSGCSQGAWGGVPVPRHLLTEAPCELSCPILAENPSLATTNLTPWLWSLKMEPALTDRLAHLLWPPHCS